MTKKKILIVENSVHITGALKSICRSAFDLRNFFEFVFVLPSGSKGRGWIEAKGFTTIYELPFLEISRRWKSLVLYVPRLLQNSLRLRAIVKREKIDMVHVNDLYNLAFPVARVLGENLPYICHIRFLPDKFPPALFNFWLGLHLRHAESVIAVSRHLRDQLMSDEKIFVIYNELPVEVRYPQGLSKYDDPTILYLSNVIQGKGHEHAIESFAKIHPEFPTWRLRLVGGDMGLEKNRTYKEQLKQLAARKGISHVIDWIDFTEDVEKEYRRACISLNFSESESFSITCLESLFFGCPIVATRSGGPAEIIDHGDTGFLVPKGDVDAMVQHMAALMKDSELRLRMSEAGQRVVRERFSVANTSFKLKKVYDRILLGSALKSQSRNM
jgi:L-malate glycosyltransferase